MVFGRGIWLITAETAGSNLQELQSWGLSLRAPKAVCMGPQAISLAGDKTGLIGEQYYNLCFHYGARPLDHLIYIVATLYYRRRLIFFLSEGLGVKFIPVSDNAPQW